VIALVIAAVIGFSSPSGNIKCEASQKLLVCSIAQSAYGKRLQRGCNGLDWHGFSMTPTGRAQILCTGGTMFPGKPPRFPKLPYGVPWKGGPFSCVVKTSGVTCSNGRHGLFVSRAGYRLF
jgi:hypothetical protein